jgi:Xaa-Pro aminopeptidase
MNNEIVTRQQELMRQKGIGALIAVSPEIIRYTTGVMVPTQSIIRERHAICVTPAEGEPTAIVVNIEEDLVKNESFISDIRSYNEFTEDPVEILVQVLKEKQLQKERLGIELDYLPAKRFETLRKGLPETDFFSCEDDFYELRTIKTADEIRIIEKIGKAAEQSIATAFQELHPGMSEKDLARLLVGEYYSRGGEKTQILVVATGERSSFLNASASERVIKSGDMIRVDLIGTMQGYYSDVCRTAVVGEPTNEQLSIWKTIVEARELVLEDVRPDNDTKKIYEKYRDFVLKRDLTPINFVGHGLGLGLHEEPYIGRYGGTVLKPGMVMCVEPIHVVPNQMGFQLEDEILITEDGHKLLTGGEYSAELPVIE